MKLVDSSVWIDHLRKADNELIELLSEGQVCLHPFIIGEILLGSIAQRLVVAELLDALASVVVASTDEVRTFLESAQLYGRGIGWVDAHLLASCRLTPNTQLLTRDKRLHSVGLDLGLV